MPATDTTTTYNSFFKVTNMTRIVERVEELIPGTLVDQVEESEDEELVVIKDLIYAKCSETVQGHIYDMYTDENIEECFDVLDTFKEIKDVTDFAKNPVYPTETKMRVINMVMYEFGC
jgi:hypothetical protein